MTIFKFTEYLNKPYDLLESKKFLYPFVVGMALFVFVFLWVFEPFGLENLPDDEKLPVIGIYSVAALALSGVQFLLIQPLVFRKYKVYNTFLWLMFHLVLTGLMNAFINSYLWNDGYITFYYILYFQGVVLAVGILPIAFFITLHYAWLMHHRAEKALAVNTRIAERPEEPHALQKTVVELKASNGKTAIECDLNQLMVLQSADNYVEIHYLQNETIQRELIRNTLTNIEKQLSNFENLFRCHKSFIVNKNFVRNLTGNAAGYKLHLKKGNYEIPVSRSLNSKIKTIF